MIVTSLWYNKPFGDVLTTTVQQLEAIKTILLVKRCTTVDDNLVVEKTSCLNKLYRNTSVSN